MIQVNKSHNNLLNASPNMKCSSFIMQQALYTLQSLSGSSMCTHSLSGRQYSLPEGAAVRVLTGAAVLTPWGCGSQGWGEPELGRRPAASSPSQRCHAPRHWLPPAAAIRDNNTPNCAIPQCGTSQCITGAIIKLSYVDVSYFTIR